MYVQWNSGRLRSHIAGTKINMLKIKNLSAVGNENYTLTNISLTVPKGETYGIIGKSHSGKTLLADSISRFPDAEITEGSISWNSKVLSKMTPSGIYHAGVFVIPQHSQDINLPVGRILEKFFPKIDSATLQGKFFDYCDQLELPRGIYQELQSPSYISSGQVKLLELIYMKIADPQLIVLDEIDFGMSDQEVEISTEFIKEFLSKEKTGLIITNNKAILDSLSPSSVHMMKDGELFPATAHDLMTVFEE